MITGIAAAMNGPRSTATDRLGGTRAGGPGGMHYTKNRGACKLDGRQLVSLARDPDAGPAAAGPGAGVRTMPPAREHIKKFGAEYHIHSVWNLAGRRGFAHARPRPRGARGRPRRRPGSQKKSSRGRRGLRRTGRAAVPLDGMHVSLAGSPGRAEPRGVEEGGRNSRPRRRRPGPDPGSRRAGRRPGSPAVTRPLDRSTRLP